MREQRKKGFRFRNIIFILVAILLAFGIFRLIRQNVNRPDQLNYKDFIAVIDEDRLATEEPLIIVPTASGIANAGLKTIKGKYTNADGKVKNFVIVLDADDYAKVKTKIEAKGISAPEYVVRPFKKVDWLGVILQIGIPILLIAGLFYLFRQTTQGNNQAFDFAKSRAQLNKKSPTTFKDVAGAEEEKEEMLEVVDFLKNPKKYYSMGARVPKGILLIGPPGTGKTLLARAVAGEAKVPFYSISGSDFVEMFVGVGASRVRDMFRTAKQNAPCIIFIDEIDAVGRQRGTGLGGGHDEREQTLNQILVEMDGFEINSGVIVIAATNRPDVLDPALLRPGRFDRTITMSNPDVNGRVAILKVHARNKAISPKVNFEDIAKRTPGFSGADLENLLNEAALLAARANRTEIKIYDIDEAIDRVLMGPAKRSRKYEEDEKWAVALHESGHAVCGLKIDNADIVQKVTIVPRGQAGGYSMMTPEKERFMQTKTQLLDTITGLLGGRVAEELFVGEISTGASNDIERATAIARAMVAEFGMSDLGPIQYEKKTGSVFLGRDYMTERAFSDHMALAIDKEVTKIIDQCYERAKQLLSEHEDLVRLLAKHLVDIETLTKEDITELVETGKLGWWEKKKAKAEADRIAQEKEAELKAIYEEQLAAMEAAKPSDDPAAKPDAAEPATPQPAAPDKPSSEEQ